MKKIFLLCTLLLFINAIAQTTTKLQDVQNLLSILQIKSTMEGVVDRGIELYQKKKPAVPQQVWIDIKNSVDYTSYMNKVTCIFDSNYSQQEIKNLVTLANASKPKLPQFKNIVQHQLYDAGNEFGKKFGELIKEKLNIKGHI